MPAEIIQFRNKPILKITQENSYTKVQIGIKKALLILESIEAIKAFVAQNNPAGPINKPLETLSEANTGAEV